MAKRYGPSITTTEIEQPIVEAPITEGIVTGGIISSNYGQGDIIVDLYSIQDLIDYAGEPNDYNYKNWFNIRDYLVSNKLFRCLRAIPTNAKNSSIKIKGTSKLKSSTWYNSSEAIGLEKPTEKFYNEDVAEFSLETFSTIGKLQIINKYVTSKQNLATAVCSNVNHYEEPIVNEEMDVLRDFDQYQAPSTPAKFERYTILRQKLNIVSVTESTDTIILTGTVEIESGDKIIIADNDVSNDGTFTVDTVSIASGQITITTVESLTTDTAALGTGSYLLGDWRTSTFIDGTLVEYSGTSWGSVSVAITKKYFVELRGNVYSWNGTIWIEESDKYIPVDSDNDGKANYARKDIFDSTLVNSDNSIKSFKDIYKDNLSFKATYDENGDAITDEILVFVLIKNETTGLWGFSESHFGSYVPTSRDANNNPNSIEKIINGESNYIYIKANEGEDIAFTSTTDIDVTNTNATSDIVLATSTITLVNQDYIDYLKVGASFELAGSTSNDGTYTIDSFKLNGSDTEIVTVESLVDETLSDLDEIFTFTVNSIGETQYFNVDASSTVVASTKTIVFKTQDITEYMAPGKQITITDSTSNDGTYTIVSAIFSTDTTIVVSETIVDETLAVTTYLTVANNFMYVVDDLRYMQINEKLKYVKFLNPSSVVETNITTIEDNTYNVTSGITILTVNKDFLGYTLNGESTLNNIYTGRVSTNMNIYGDPRSAQYDISNADASEGYSVSDLIIYDISPTNSAGSPITDYSDLEATDLDSSAEIFADKDVVDVDMLIPYATIDEFGNYHVDKMSDVAERRTRCFVPVVPFDELLYLNSTTTDEMTENVIEQFGNQRNNLFTGSFTKFGKQSSTFYWMKYQEDQYNNKFRWLPVAGDVARLIAAQDTNPSRGLWYPIAGNEVANQIRVSYLPNDDQREDLIKNGINTLLKRPTDINPIVFSNVTSYRIDGLFKVMSYRLMLNSIEKFVETNLVPLFFSFKDDILYKRISDIIDPFLNDIVVRRGLVSATLSFPYVPNEPSDTITMQIDLVPTGVVEHFIVNVKLTESGFEIEEIA